MPLSEQDVSAVKKVIADIYPTCRYAPVFEPISGGSINKCFRISLSNEHQIFLKVNDASSYPRLFACEKNGLQLIQQNGINTPEILNESTDATRQYLLLKWINPGNKTTDFWKKFGERLAALHYTSNTRFGLTEDNYIGSLYQSNSQHDNWVSFLIEERLKPQILLAEKSQYLSTSQLNAFEKLFSRLTDFYPPDKPALLHGDLWSGNFLCDENSNPVLIDPAVYFGHRSMDIGMTKLFGGFNSAFYQSYQHHYPLLDNFHEQCQLAQLYPLLVHLNLFGISYLSDIEEILNRFT